jgi:hypothetical protein
MTNDLTISVTCSHLAFKCEYSNLGMSTFNSVMRCVHVLHDGLQVDKSVQK